MPDPTHATDPSLQADPPAGETVRGQGYWQIVWRQFRKNVPAVIGLAMVLSLFLLAVIAPFLAGKYPYYWHTAEEGLTFPLFRSLTNMDLTLIAGLVLVLLVPVTRRLLKRTKWQFMAHNHLGRAVVINIGLFLWLAAALVSPRLGVGSYLLWLSILGAVAGVIGWLAFFSAVSGGEPRPTGVRRGIAVGIYFLVASVLLLTSFRVVPDRIFIERMEVVDGEEVRYMTERDYKAEVIEREGVQCLFPPIPYAPSEDQVGDKFEPPSAEHIFGTDSVTRSVASRMFYATRTSLAVGFISVSISLVIGILVGGISGYFGGKVDLMLQRLVEIFICFPTFFLILFIIALYGAKLWLIMLAIGLVGWAGVSRLIRAEILRVRTLDYVTAARGLGLSPLRIILRHAVPNAIAPVLVSATFRIAGAVAFEASLSFLSLGDPNHPSWGYLLTRARPVAHEHPMLLIIPGVAIFFAILGYNLVGEGLRDAIDPRLKV